MTTELSPQLRTDLLAALSVGNIPDVHWLQGDDLCDCTFQRVGQWTNPYLGKTLRVRLCCIWAELYKQFPQFVQDIDASYDSNTHQWVNEPQDWDSEDADMPLPLWYRQIARREGKSLSEVRNSARVAERPRALGSRWVDRTADFAVVDASRRERLRLTGWL